MVRAGICLFIMPLALSACGAATPPPASHDGGPGITETPAFWGFADQTCWVYDDGSGNDLYTIAVDQDSSAVGNGIVTYHLTYRDSGLDQREDYLQIVGETLVDWRHVDYPANMPQVYTEYSPPPVVFQANLTAGEPAQTSTMAMESTTSSSGTTTNMTVPLTFIVTNGGSSMVKALGTMESATQFIVTQTMSNGSATADNFWFTPNVGIVQLQLSQSSTWALVKVLLNTTSTNCFPD